MAMAELYYIDPQSQLSSLVDTQALIEGMQEADMVPLVAEDFERHKLGRFIIAGLGVHNPAIGYAACREIITDTMSPAEPNTDQPPTVFHKYALIGSLYLHPGIRGHGIAQQLIQRVTDQTFQNFQSVDACVAACNSNSLGAFTGNGYQESELTIGQSITGSPDKTIVIMPRAEWRQLAGTDHVQ
jgi:GNAT superfamily N-acetyltransferase